MTNEAQTQIEPQPSGKSWLNLPQNVWVLTATSFLTDISTDMVTNLIPLFLTGVLGQATAVVGVIDGVAETTASIMKIFSGALSDKLGKRKGLAILGYGLSTLSKPFLYFANSWGMVMGVRFSDRLGKGIRTAPKEALLDQHIDRLIGKFDLIMTNPPFGKGKYDATKGKNYLDGLEKMRSNKLFYHPDVQHLLDDPRYQCELGYSWTSDRNKKKPLENADPASLFIDRNLQLLKPGGRLLIVLPDGILSNSGDKYIREYLMGLKDEKAGEFFGGKAVVKAVVSLPTQTFAISGTGAKTSFLFVQKKGTYMVGGHTITVDRQGPIFMAVAEHVGYIKKGNDEQPDPMGNDLKLIADAYAKGDINDRGN